MKTRAFVSLVVGLIGTTICLAGDFKTEQALRDLDAQMAKDAGSKDVDKTVSYYADDAVVLPAHMPIAKTKDEIRNLWKSVLTSPGVVIIWKTGRADVAGDIGYTSGFYALTMNDAGGKPTIDTGKYLAVWKKQAAGNWKVVADMWNSDQAEKK